MPEARPDPRPVPRPAAVARDAVLAGLEGRLPPPPVAIAYRLALIVVAVAMVILPLLYLGLVALVGYATYWHAVHDLSILRQIRSARVIALVYLAPLFAGVVLVVFLVKPLFARREEASKPRSLRRSDEPLLFEFIDRLCATLGAPKPSRIDVDCMINASAGLHLGMVSGSGSKLVLTIGLPLAAGLSLRELAGVLAHEFGHFSQSAGMRLSQLIRRINAWFARVVYERDRLDAWLVGEAEGASGTVAVVLRVAQACVWLSRRILWVLMMIGHALSCLLMRRMEHDADGYEVNLAGSDTFAATALRLRVLGLASESAHRELSEAWREGKLGDDLPGLVAARAADFPREALVKIRKLATESATGWLDTHPSDRERVARAKRLARPGVYRPDGPASVLFRDFPALCRQTTLAYYREQIGDEVGEKNLIPIADLTARREANQKAGEAAERYYQGGLSDLQPVFLGRSGLGSPPPAESLVDRLRGARDRVAASAEATRRAVAGLAQGDRANHDIRAAETLLRAKVRVDARDFGLPAATPEGLSRAGERARHLTDEAGPRIDAFAAATRERLALGLGAIAVPDLAGRIQDATARSTEALALIAALASLESAFADVSALRAEYQGLGALLSHVKGEVKDTGLVRTIEEGMSGLHRLLTRIQGALTREPYPFALPAGEASIGQYLLDAIPLQKDLGGLLGASRALLGQYYTLYFRIMARLAAIAEEVEGAAGLPPLPPPPRPTA